MSAQFESLEARKHLSASIIAKGTIVTVTGSSDADVINVANINGKKVDISVYNARTRALLHKVFNTVAVKQVNVLAGAGDDQIFASSLSTRVKFSCDGGAGNDQIQGTLYGSDTITGGTGRDIIVGGIGKDVIYAKADGSRDSINVATGSKVYRDSTDTLTLT